MCNIAASKRLLAFDAVVLASCAIAFYSNQLLLKPSLSGMAVSSGDPVCAFFSTLATCHLNDFLGGIAFLAYVNILFDIVQPARRISRWPSALILILACALCWEGIAPMFLEDSVRDPIDVAAYVMGAITYMALSRAPLIGSVSSLDARGIPPLPPRRHAQTGDSAR